MKQENRDKLDRYYDDAGSWASDRLASLHSSRRRAWVATGVMTFLAIAEAIALIALTPLKTVEPYTLLVDRQTGNVETLRPLDGAVITPDEALTRSFLVQYVIARETFDIGTVQEDYRKVVLWSDAAARTDYISQIQISNPESPLMRFPRETVIEVEISSVSMLSESTAMVRYARIRHDRGAQPRSLGNFVAVVSWGWSGEPMTVADRIVNPLGFQVTQYRTDIEAIPEISTAPFEAQTVDESEGEAASPGGRRIGDRERR